MRRIVKVSPVRDLPFAFHVYVEALRWNKEHPDKRLPPIALRIPHGRGIPLATSYRFVRLVERVDGGAFELSEVPGGLPGTPGVEVVLSTDRPFSYETTFDFCGGPPILLWNDGETKDERFKEALYRYTGVVQ
jgi:hypothetical protein